MIDRNEEVTITMPYWMAQFIVLHVDSEDNGTYEATYMAAHAHSSEGHKSLSDYMQNVNYYDALCECHEGRDKTCALISDAIVALEDKHGA